MSYQDIIQEKRLEAAKKKEYQDSLSELRKIQQMTAMASSTQKPNVILTDQTDLGDKLKDMVSSFTAAVEKADTTSLSQDQIDELKSLRLGLADLEAAIQKQSNDSKTLNKEVISALKSLKLDPSITVEAANITVPTPKVTVQERPVDFSSLETTLREVFTPPETKIDLSNYRAQDIKDSGDIQYVGFVNPDGNWYIIENHTRDNKLRYLFGMSDYSSAWSKASRYKYYLLNEAVNAVRS